MSSSLPSSGSSTLVAQTLTKDWALIQGGTDPGRSETLMTVFVVLELDEKAIRDWWLLSHSGVAGQAEASELLWTLLSDKALDPAYEDLSRWVSNQVNTVRQRFDRPPDASPDLNKWAWFLTGVPRNMAFSAWAAEPFVGLDFRTGPGGVPLPPPDLWL